jgi:protein TonB
VPLEPEVELPPVPKSQKQEVRQQHRENRPLERTVEPAAAPIISPPPIVQLKPIAETPVQIANGGAPTTGSGQAAANGQGQTNLNAQNVITPAIWASEPIYYSPERAAQLKESGSATIRCELLSNRHVRNCRVVNESPKGYGFGRAALAASRDFVINPPKFNGQVIQSSHMDITLNFTR